jgi:DNA-binding NtrC family response regulator
VKQVLLINDDSQVRNRTAAMLHEMGWEVWIADEDEVIFESLVARRPMMAIVDIETLPSPAAKMKSFGAEFRPRAARTITS